MQPTIVTSAPRRAAATAWLAPLPPCAMCNSLPIIVSPADGRLSAMTTISMLQLPITTMRFIITP